jgi:4-amino-4-deoxy-L-arabinose transferase-like glycosyltransferase
MDGRSTVAAAALAWAAFGLALMTKGPQFPLLILLGVVLALRICQPRLPLLKTLHPWMALVAMTLPLAYYGYIALQFDDALSLWRSEMVQGDDVPLWYRPLRFYYPLMLIASLAPWLIVAGKMSVDVWKRREPTALILTSCVLVALVLVSFSGKLREHYTLPLVPLCTALMGWSIFRAFDSVSGTKAQSRRFNLLVWAQFALAGLITVTVIVKQVSSIPESGQGIVTSCALAWLGMAVASYALAIVMLKRNLSTAFAALVAAVLLASGAYPWTGGWQSGFAQSTREFIQDMEANLPEERVLYLDRGKHMLHFYYYYGNGNLTVLSLDNWQPSKGSDPAPYFITSLARIEDSGIEGKIIFQQQSNDADADDIRVVFQPGPRG